MSESGAGANRVARATFRIVFTRRAGLRLPRLVADLRFVAAKVIRRLRRLERIWKRQIERGRRNRGLRGRILSLSHARALALARKKEEQD